MRKLLVWLSAVIIGYSCTRPAPSGPFANWQNQDLQKDGVFGISTEKAYQQLLKGKKASTVIVAIIDSGIDTLQEDLRPVLWTDPVTGSHGRNYIGFETGKEDFIPMLATQRDDSSYHKILDDYNLHVNRLQAFISQLKGSKKTLEQLINNNYQPHNPDERQVLNLLSDRSSLYPDTQRLRFYEIDHLLDVGQYHLEHGLNRAIVPEESKAVAIDTNDISTDALGLVPEPNVAPEHGTHMAGIIAAVRNNGKGIDGIADHARIMSLKLFNNIREMRNDDLAAAIRFAVDHGARVVSMSFGKVFSLHRDVVDAAVKYAMARDVLIIHSAGNDGMNTDDHSFFPSPEYLEGSIASAWITVGATGYRDDSTLLPAFSNYGQHTVDVFAPGIQITSTIPHSRLASWDGTSEATPVVAGLAALIWSYYPQLTAIQVKGIIMRSVVKHPLLTNKCVSGGIVNAYDALKLAESLTSQN